MYQHPYIPNPLYGISPPRAPGMTSKLTRRASIDGTSTDKECGTPSSSQGSPFQPYPSPPGIDAINLDASEETDDGDNVSGPKSRTYAARYTGRENEVLTQSWVNISEDSIVGNAQKLDAMWKRITADYNKNQPTNCPERHWKLLKSHYYMVQRFVSEFNGLFNQMKRDWGSGQSDTDILVHVMTEWAKKHDNHAFSHLGMWQILKECPKWIAQHERDHCGRKKTKISVQGGYTSSSNAEDADEERVRPIDQKAAKRKAKMKQPSKDNIIEEIKQNIVKNMEEYKAITTEKLELQKTHNRIAEYEIIMKDTTGMTPKQLQIHLKLVDKLMKSYDDE